MRQSLNNAISPLDVQRFLKIVGVLPVARIFGNTNFALREGEAKKRLREAQASLSGFLTNVLEAFVLKKYTSKF